MPAELVEVVFVCSKNNTGLVPCPSLTRQSGRFEVIFLRSSSMMVLAWKSRFPRRSRLVRILGLLIFGSKKKTSVGKGTSMTSSQKNGWWTQIGTQLGCRAWKILTCLRYIDGKLWGKRINTYPVPLLRYFPLLVPHQIIFLGWYLLVQGHLRLLPGQLRLVYTYMLYDTIPCHLWFVIVGLYKMLQT